MIPFIEQVLYTDPQARHPENHCALCGRECYGRICLRCQRDCL